MQISEEQRLIEKLHRIEALYAGAATPGERDAADSARNRILERLKNLQERDRSIEFKFTFADMWSRRLFVAVLRRYGINPYRYRGQRYTTVMANLPKSFVEEVLWPEFEKLNGTLRSYLHEITSRVIREGIHRDDSEAEVRQEKQSITF